MMVKDEERDTGRGGPLNQGPGLTFRRVPVAEGMEEASLIYTKRVSFYSRFASGHTQPSGYV